MKKIMKACVLHGIRDLRVEEMNIPGIEDGKVLLKVCAAGICGSDVERVYTKGTYHYPTVIGHEFAGRVVSTTSSDRDWLGKRVTVFPLIPCMECDSCRTGHYAQCKNYNYYGSRCDGGFAEYIAVQTWNLMPLSEGTSYQSAAMFEPAAVASHALSQAGELLGRSIVILGVGAIGLILGQLALNAGCSKVILVARSKDKVAFAQRLGFQYVIHSGEEDVQERILALTAGKGADIAVEGCGQSETLNVCLHSVCAFGTVVCMGNPMGEMQLERNVYWEILRKQLTIKGTWNSSYRAGKSDWELVQNMVETGRLALEPLVTGTYRLEEANQAFEDIYFHKNESVHIKSMFVNEEDERNAGSCI